MNKRQVSLWSFVDTMVVMKRPIWSIIQAQKQAQPKEFQGQERMCMDKVNVKYGP